MRDLDIRAGTIGRALEEPLLDAVEREAWRRVDSLLERIASDERLLALGVCNVAGDLVRKTRLMPSGLDCRTADGSSEGGAMVRLSAGTGARRRDSAATWRCTRRNAAAGSRPQLRGAPQPGHASLRDHPVHGPRHAARADLDAGRPHELARLGGRRPGHAAGRGRDPPVLPAAAGTAAARRGPAQPAAGHRARTALFRPGGRNQLGPGDAAPAAARATARGRDPARVQPRALHPREVGARSRGAATRERPGHGGRARDARLLRHVDRARKRLGRPRGGRLATTAFACRRASRATRCAGSG